MFSIFFPADTGNNVSAVGATADTRLPGIWRWDIATTSLLNSKFVGWIRNIGRRRVCGVGA